MNNILILTGETGTGKTTRLNEWLENKKNIKGVLTPVVSGLRMFYDIERKEYFPMIAENEDSFEIGKYRFSRKAFNKAEEIIRKGINNADMLVIDEIGPLEIRGEGFYNILTEILKLDKHTFQLLLIVRKSMLEEFIFKFRITHSELLKL
jgi:nucleoside-triphosphatase THEP1